MNKRTRDLLDRIQDEMEFENIKETLKAEARYYRLRLDTLKEFGGFTDDQAFAILLNLYFPCDMDKEINLFDGLEDE